MKKLKYPVFLILSAFMFVMSCKKSKKLQPDEIPDPNPAESGRYIPVKFEAKGFILNLKYKGNTALLEEITDSDRNKTVITYTTGQQLYKLEKYSNGDLFYVVYYEQGDLKVTNKALLFAYNTLSHSYSPSGFYTISYNDQQKMSALNYYNNNNLLIRTDAFSYSRSASLSAINTTTYPGPTDITNYTFDQKKGIGSNIVNSQLLATELEYWFFLCTDNNLLNTANQKSPAENISFNYEYNTNGYPSGVKFTNDNNTQNIRITYKQLDP